MKFIEFPLYNAVHDVYLEFERQQLKPRSADWLIYQNKRLQLKKLIYSKMSEESFSEEKILKAWDDFGKNKEKYKLLISVANTFGHHCFYDNRNKGCCSDIMSVERLPGHRNEPFKAENCVIVCKRHNSDRR